MMSTGFLIILKFLFILTWYIKNYFQLKNNCIMKHMSIFSWICPLLKMQINSKIFFSEGWKFIYYMLIFLKRDSYWCILTFTSFLCFENSMFALCPVYSLQLECSERQWSSETWVSSEYYPNPVIHLVSDTDHHCREDLLLLSDYVQISSFFLNIIRGHLAKIRGDTNCISVTAAYTWIAKKVW